MAAQKMHAAGHAHPGWPRGFRGAVHGGAVGKPLQLPAALAIAHKLEACALHVQRAEVQPGAEQAARKVQGQRQPAQAERGGSALAVEGGVGEGEARPHTLPVEFELACVELDAVVLGDALDPVTHIRLENGQQQAGAAEQDREQDALRFKPEEWGLFGMNANLIGQLSWNSGTDSEGFLAEHYSALYGPAAEEMAGYFAQMQHLLADLGPCVGHYDLDYTLRATDQLLRPAAEHLGRAIAISAGAHSRYREAVRAAQVGFHVLRKIHAWRQLIVRLREARPEKRKARLEDVLRAGDELVAWTGGKARKDLLDRDRIALVVRTEHEALQRQYG